MTRKELMQKVQELERRIRELEARRDTWIAKPYPSLPLEPAIGRPANEVKEWPPSPVKIWFGAEPM